MTNVMDTQKENVTKTFYAVIGAPVVAGRKMKEFGTELFIGTSVDDLEAAGREMTGSIKHSKVVEQIQERVEVIQEIKVVEQIQEKVDVEQFQEKVGILREQLETTLHNWREQFTPVVTAPKPVKVQVKVETATPKKTAPKATAKTATPRKTAPKATAKSTETKKTSSEQ
ncbi:MAG TPA: hypothetical protein VFD97_04645 [Acidimicrobiia bacterium]|nr:hypothetical protein [Acidimicrobiia bacterium]